MAGDNKLELDFWHQIWESNRIPFHEIQVNAYLDKYYSFVTQGLPKPLKIFIPLCGKATDLCYFNQKKDHVYGVEFIKKAIIDLGIENSIEWDSSHENQFRSGNMAIWNVDIFELDSLDFPRCNFIYDRASMIALPPHLRKRYTQILEKIATHDCRQLLIIMEHREKHQSPPYSISLEEIYEHYSNNWDITQLDQKKGYIQKQPVQEYVIYLRKKNGITIR